MGEVRLWRDRRIGRDVAVKIARPGLGGEGWRRFAREALIYAARVVRRARVAMCLAVVLVPALLELGGAIVPTLVTTASEYRIVPAIADPLPTWVLLMHFVVIALVGTNAVFAALDRARRLEIRARSQARMLERVLDPRRSRSRRSPAERPVPPARRSLRRA